MGFFILGGGLFLTESEVVEEAKRVLQRGIQRFKDKAFHLERWGPKVGCLQLGVHANHY